jgi:superfamily II DNA/RNA helicase
VDLLTAWTACYAALLLVPTRELALQTSQVCKELGKHMGVQVNIIHSPTCPPSVDAQCSLLSAHDAACMLSVASC